MSSSPLSSVAAVAVAFLVRLFLLTWDVVTFPAFFLLYRPWAKTAGKHRVRARIVGRTDSSLTVEALPKTCAIRDEIDSASPKLDTLDKMWRFAVERGGSKSCLGTRECFGEESERQDDGRNFVKLIQGDYKWMDYEEVDRRAADFARGMADEVGVSARDRVAIYADSRAEWMLVAGAAFKSSVALVTLYTNLGEDDVVYGLGQTRVRTVITSQELLPKLCRLLKRAPLVRNVVFFESRVAGKKVTEVPPEALATGVRVHPFLKVEERGRGSRTRLTAPSPSDLAILMYTSGSTGAPKGALLTHGQLSASVTSCLVAACDILPATRTPDEAYLAYLPMAHIFELTHELIVMILGIRVGYSSPNTLTDAGTMIKKGQKGDATVLKPTVMIAVPLILDRIYSGMRAKISAKGAVFSALFDVFYEYRLYWSGKGFDTPVLNRIVFDKFRAALGGRIGLLVGGGAPLSAQVHDFLRTCLRVTVAQGYGLTETAGGISLADADDLSTGRVGHPLQGVRVRLEDWDEGGYTVRDREGPRGELVVGCPWVAAGYFEMPDKTREGFHDEGGIRWFRTGDVGQLMPDGTLKVVDRKKDLVKLQLGEYVSLGKIESCLKLLPLAESVCVYADSAKLSTVALVVPVEDKLRQLANELVNNNNSVGAAGDSDSQISFEKLCGDSRIVDFVLKQVKKQSRDFKLNKYETPGAVDLVPEQWLPETGLVTAAMKLRRKQIQNRYQNRIDRMYAEIEEESK